MKLDWKLIKKILNRKFFFESWYFGMSLIFWGCFSERYLWKSPRTRELLQRRVRGGRGTSAVSFLTNFFVSFREKSKKIEATLSGVRPKAKNSKGPSHDERADSEEMERFDWLVSRASPRARGQWARPAITPQQKGRHAEEFHPSHLTDSRFWSQKWPSGKPKVSWPIDPDCQYNWRLTHENKQWSSEGKT